MLDIGRPNFDLKSPLQSRIVATVREVAFVELGDAELATRIAESAGRGARAEESELCRRFAPRIRLYGLRHLRSEDAALDLVQRVLLVTLEKLRTGQVQQPERLASFVLGTARLCAREAARGRSREVVVELDTLDVPSAQVEPETLGKQQLAHCMGELEERQRAVLVLSFFQELSAAQISTTLGLEVGNVRVIRHRAIARLRQCLGHEAVPS